jgi:hypothetical protein
MNLAILIGVSDYTDNENNLPACRDDINSMIAVIEATEKYEQIIKFDGEVRASDVKTRMTQAIESLSGSQVDEVFFYYTGHGDFQDNEFYFILSDFSEGKLRQTSLQNSEMDNWLRTLNPRLTVKIVDACHSGLSYVKDKSYLKTHLQKTIERFNSCYFMFSSTSEQYSYQDNSLSYFTRSFIQALNCSESDTIRYKDIIDFISDDFESSQIQTPVFVTQATFTEVFTQRMSGLTEVTKKFIGVTQADNQPEPQLADIPQVLTLAEMVRKDAESYKSKDEVVSLLTGLKELIGKHKYSDDFANLYDMEYSFENSLYSLPNKALIGEWLDKHQDEYFASVEEGQEEYQAQVFSIRSLRYSSAPEYETRYRRKVIGFKLTDESPFNWVKLVAKPKYPNIPWCNCSIVLVLSKRVVRFFHFFTEYREKNWDEREPQLEFSWKTVEYLLIENEKINAFVSNLQEKFAYWVVEQVRKRFPQPATSKSDGNEAK